jgi:hypothetical protein
MANPQAVLFRVIRHGSRHFSELYSPANLAHPCVRLVTRLALSLYSIYIELSRVIDFLDQAFHGGRRGLHSIQPPACCAQLALGFRRG